MIEKPFFTDSIFLQILATIPHMDKIDPWKEARMLSNRQIFYFYIALTDRYGLRFVLSFFRINISFSLIADMYRKVNHIILEWDFDIYYNPDYQLINWVLDAYGFEIANGKQFCGFEIASGKQSRKRLRRKA